MGEQQGPFSASLLTLLVCLNCSHMVAAVLRRLDLKSTCEPTVVVSTQSSANLHEKVRLINVC